MPVNAAAAVSFVVFIDFMVRKGKAKVPFATATTRNRKIDTMELFPAGDANAKFAEK